MKILFDHQIFSMQKYGGASRYFCELLKHIPIENWNTSLWLSNNEYLKDIKTIKYQNFCPQKSFRGQYYLMDLLNRPCSVIKIMQGNFDILHQTHYTPYYSLNLLKNKKLVVTIHDMNHTKFGDMYPKSFIYDINRIQKNQKQLIERADKVVVVSNSTKQDLIDLWGIDSQKIEVIYHGVNVVKNVSSENIINCPYLLYVGERRGFKNFDRFIQVFAQISKKNKELKLVCTGLPFSIQEQNELQQLHILDKTIQISASESVMSALYSNAEMLVFPSISEGFGMPILEAMARDCPVVLSHSSCFPEIAGEAGVFFNPYKIDDMREQIETVLYSTTLRNEKKLQGKKRITQFSWEKTAENHIKLYSKLI